MSRRFDFLFHDSSELHAVNCPLVITGRALMRDLEKNRSLAQLTFRSLAATPIREVSATIHYVNAYGKPLGTLTTQYKNLNCGRNESFGTDVPVLIPDPNARRFSVVHLEIVFEDDSRWSDSVSMVPKSAPKATPKTAPAAAQGTAPQNHYDPQAAQRREQ